ncbi:hypothetical protein STRDD10_00413 [Streptococcus sp. DD10]|uniref:hypothetical protein n=1 Tax=Streptococcus sp. DD10 TaxID=1777878 RepID=UPI00079C6F33|nr:hypothetical protein [Streptococcus sp. DD10]KXT75177.1 hypothetical protein STRDD10_00413 [Streptococcus sp. DD10]
MYKIINKLTKKEENFDNRDSFLSRIETINEQMREMKLEGNYSLYQVTDEGEILSERSLQFPFPGIVDQVLEDFGTQSTRKNGNILNAILGRKKAKKTPVQPVEPLPVQETVAEAPQPAPVLVQSIPLEVKVEEKPSLAQTAADERKKIAESLQQHHPVKTEPSQPQMTANDFAHIEEVLESQEIEESPVDVEMTAEEDTPEDTDVTTESAEQSEESKHVPTVSSVAQAPESATMQPVIPTADVVDSFEVQTLNYIQSIKSKITSNDYYVIEAQAEIAACQARIEELQLGIESKQSQTSKLKELFFHIDEVS